MGGLLVLIIHRVVVFFYLIIQSSGYLSFDLGLSYLEFLAWDYFTLIVAVLLGFWYGIWVGGYWYELIYEQGTHGGLVHHLVERYFPISKPSYDLKNRVAEAAKKIEEDIWQMEELVKDVPVLMKSVAVKRKIVSKKIIKKP